MEKIRIGTDINLAVDLRQFFGSKYLEERVVYNPGDTDFENIDENDFVNKRSELYYPNQYTTDAQGVSVQPEGTPVSIREVKAILVNTSLQQERMEDIRKKSRFISRFPIEPCVDAFTSTPYDICCSGYPTWRAYPHMHCMTPYHGFGWRPEWGGIYKRLPRVNDTEYIANVAATKQANKVEVIFPARHQLRLGKYTLILVVKMYCPGYNLQNLKTVTVDIPDVFELVATSAEGVDTGVTATVSTIIDRLPEGDPYTPYNPYTPGVDGSDVYVSNGEFDDGVIALNRTDGRTVTIDVSSVTNWFNESE